MSRSFLVSYWVTGRQQPENHVVVLDELITDKEIPVKLQERLSVYETYGGEAYWPEAITLINFWEINNA